MKIQRNYNNKDNKKHLENCEHHPGSSKQVLDFEVTTKFIINRIQENFDSSKDSAEALRMIDVLSSDKWRPALSARSAEEESACDRERR